MNVFASIVSLLPLLFSAASKLYEDIHHDDHKQAVHDGLDAAAAAVSAVAPQHAQAATDAATAAKAVASGIYQVLADVNGKPAPAVAAADASGAPVLDLPSFGVPVHN